MKRARFLLLPLMALIAFAGSAFTRVKTKLGATGMPGYYYDSFQYECEQIYVYSCGLDNLGEFCTYFDYTYGYSTMVFEFGNNSVCYTPLYYEF